MRDFSMEEQEKERARIHNHVRHEVFSKMERLPGETATAHMRRACAACAVREEAALKKLNLRAYRAFVVSERGR